MSETEKQEGQYQRGIRARVENSSALFEDAEFKTMCKELLQADIELCRKIGLNRSCS